MECLRSEVCSFLIVLQGQDLSLLNHDFSEVEVTLKMLLNDVLVMFRAPTLKRSSDHSVLLL